MRRKWRGSGRARKADVLENEVFAMTTGKWNTRPPVNRTANFLYSSLSFGVKALSFTSSSRVLRRDTSLTNLLFHALNDSTATGVPRVRASSAFNDELCEYANVLQEIGPPLALFVPIHELLLVYVPIYSG